MVDNAKLPSDTLLAMVQHSFDDESHVMKRDSTRTESTVISSSSSTKLSSSITSLTEYFNSSLSSLEDSFTTTGVSSTTSGGGGNGGAARRRTSSLCVLLEHDSNNKYKEIDGCSMNVLPGEGATNDAKSNDSSSDDDGEDSDSSMVVLTDDMLTPTTTTTLTNMEVTPAEARRRRVSLSSLIMEAKTKHHLQQSHHTHTPQLPLLSSRRDNDGINFNTADDKDNDDMLLIVRRGSFASYQGSGVSSVAGESFSKPTPISPTLSPPRKKKLVYVNPRLYPSSPISSPSSISSPKSNHHHHSKHLHRHSYHGPTTTTHHHHHHKIHSNNKKRNSTTTLMDLSSLILDEM